MSDVTVSLASLAGLLRRSASIPSGFDPTEPATLPPVDLPTLPTPAIPDLPASLVLATPIVRSDVAAAAEAFTPATLPVVDWTFVVPPPEPPRGPHGDPSLP